MDYKEFFKKAEEYDFNFASYAGGPIFSVEELYQAFKERVFDEIMDEIQKR